MKFQHCKRGHRYERTRNPFAVILSEAKERNGVSFHMELSFGINGY